VKKQSIGQRIATVVVMIMLFTPILLAWFWLVRMIFLWAIK